MKIKDLIAELEKYDGEQEVWYMDGDGSCHPLVEVSLYDSEAPQSDENELSITTKYFWED